MISNRLQQCLCGCGETVNAGREFRPEHDQKLRKKMEDAVGGIEALKRLVENHLQRSL